MLHISGPSAALSKPPADGKCIITLTPYSNICLVYQHNKLVVFEFLMCLTFAPVPAQKTPVPLPEELKFLVQEPANSESPSESSVPTTGM